MEGVCQCGCAQGATLLLLLGGALFREPVRAQAGHTSLHGSVVWAVGRAVG